MWVCCVCPLNPLCTITVSCTAGTNYTAPASKTVTVKAEFILATLNDNSWAAIHSVSGTGASYWAVGDRKAVSVSGTVGTKSVSGTYYVFILGFNHNGATGIDFGTFKTALTTQDTPLRITESSREIKYLTSFR